MMHNAICNKFTSNNASKCVVKSKNIQIHMVHLGNFIVLQTYQSNPDDHIDKYSFPTRYHGKHLTKGICIKISSA